MNTATPGPAGSDDAGPTDETALRTTAEDDPPEPGADAPSEDEAGGVSVYTESESLTSDDCRWLAHHLEQVAEQLNQRVDRLAVLVVDDAHMTELHQRHMNINETTDVLTFPADDGDTNVIDVDVAVCVDEAARQAGERDHDVRHELLLYAVHALLHCAGFDDVDDAGATAMHRREDEILRAIGVGDVFDRKARP